MAEANFLMKDLSIDAFNEYKEKERNKASNIIKLATNEKDMKQKNTNRQKEYELNLSNRERLKLIPESGKSSIDISIRNQHGFRLQRFGEYSVTKPSWIVRGIIEQNVLGVLFGDSATGKSFIALDLAASVASGFPFQGRDVEKSGNVIYIAGEGREGINRRLTAWSIHNSVDLTGEPIFISSMGISLCDDEMMVKVGEAVDECVSEAGNPILLIIDTWARNLGGDENGSMDSSKGVKILDEFRDKYGCAIIIIHHSGHDRKRARGSTVLRASADVEYRVVRGSDEVIHLENTKSKDAATPVPIAFRLLDVELGLFEDDGRPVVSAVLEEIFTASIKKKKKGLGIWEKEAFDTLSRLVNEQKDRLGDPESGQQCGRVLFTAWQAACISKRFIRQRFSDAKISLIGQELIFLDGEFVSFQRGRLVETIAACPDYSAPFCQHSSERE